MTSRRRRLWKSALLLQVTRGQKRRPVLDKERLVKELKTRKMHLYPRLFALLAPAVAGQFATTWEPVERLAILLGRLPQGALHFLVASPTGGMVISPVELPYARGPQKLHRLQVENVAFVSAESLLGDGLISLRAIAHLYDHLLGSAGAVRGPNLSGGVGVTDEWTEVGAQIPRLFALGHNPDPACQKSPADYFAQSVALYAVRPRELNAADPNMHKLLKRSFFSETFWRQ